MRHKTHVYNLNPDYRGWISIGEVLRAFRKPLEVSDVLRALAIQATAEKQRWELLARRKLGMAITDTSRDEIVGIRVLQGMSHYIDERAIYHPLRPGDWHTAEHYTSWNALTSIMIEGFISGGCYGAGHRRHVMFNPLHRRRSATCPELQG